MMFLGRGGEGEETEKGDKRSQHIHEDVEHLFKVLRLHQGRAKTVDAKNEVEFTRCRNKKWRC